VTARIGVVLVVSASLALPSGAAAQRSISHSCDTPTSSDSCQRWYTGASVSLQWTWSPLGTLISGCQNATFTAEAVVERSCTVEWPDTSITQKIWIGIDRTPPQLVGVTPGRPANPNGWFNRPVQLTFQGTDATSGVASCSSMTYGGPDGLGVPIAGSCSDVAGNVGSGTLPINYDATAPRQPSVGVLPGNKQVSLEWSAPPDALAQVVRSRKGAKPVVVFTGASEHLTDHRLHNGRRYRYIVTLIDQAGNRSADAASAVPTTSPLLLPAHGARVHSAPTLVWKPVRGARYYNAQLLRRGHKILTRWPRGPHLQLHKLIPARYCWYVWPGFGKRSERRYGKLLGKSCFTVVGG
jgi:hypothetical protein